jgi:hypothetical protein
MKMKKLSLILFWLALLPAGFTQQKGIVEGRLVNRTDPTIIARSVELDIVELGSGMNIIKTTTTDNAGKFRIEGLPATGRLMIRAVYKDVNYHSQFSMDASGKANVEIEVFEPTASMEAIKVESAGMAFQMVGDQLQSLETITFRNLTKPPRTLMNPEGNFRFSKPAGLADLPKVRVTAPGSRMPVVQSPLESPDGQSYYSLYPLKPGVTLFEVQQTLPYANHNYTYSAKIYQDIASMDIGVSPADVTVTGQGLTRVSVDSQQNFAIYRRGPIKAGSEIAWTFSGGTPVAAGGAPESGERAKIEAAPETIGRNALVLGPGVLIGLILVLWYAFTRMQNGPQKTGNSRARELKERREQLLNVVADLDHRNEIHAIDEQEFLKKRDETMHQLRRISLLQKM